MDNSTRLQYLEAMGIDVWIPREAVHVTDNEPVIELYDDSWVELQGEVVSCKKCDLCTTRKQTVFGEGNIDAEWMLIGQAPEQNEEMEGRPFVGQHGLLLTEMIRSIGLKREDVYITNLLKCSPPEGRDPKVEEINTCYDYVSRQITLVKPKIILAIGRVAAQRLLNTKQPLSKLRGEAHQLDGIPLVVVYHPAYLLRSLLEKRKAWQDLQLAIKTKQEKQ